MRSLPRVFTARRCSDSLSDAKGSTHSLPDHLAKPCRRVSGYNARPRRAPERSHSHGNVNHSQHHSKEEHQTSEKIRRVSWSDELVTREIQMDPAFLKELEQLDLEDDGQSSETLEDQHLNPQKNKVQNERGKTLPGSESPPSVIDGSDDLYFM